MVGSIFLREGVYHVTRTLRLNRRVHIFGRGRAELRGLSPAGSHFIVSTSSSATLDRLRIDNQAKSGSCILYITAGHLRLQSCDVSCKVGNDGLILYASGPSTIADALGCSFSGGGGIAYWDGASGRVEGCRISNVSGGAGITLGDAGTSPLVSRNTIHDCNNGVRILRDVDPSWTLGEGNVITDCAEGDVVDVRAH